MKKSFVLVALVCLSVMTFAQGLSVGVGGSFSPNFFTVKQSVGSDWGQQSISSSFFGGAAFVDAKYVEASVGIGANSKSYSTSISYSSSSLGSGSSTNGSDAAVGTYLALSALGKYPFAIGSFTLFPLLGIEYDLNLSYKDSNGNDLKSAMTSDQKASLN